MNLCGIKNLIFILLVLPYPIYLIYVILRGHVRVRKFRNPSQQEMESFLSDVREISRNKFISSQTEWRPDDSTIRGFIKESYDVTLKMKTYHPIVSIYTLHTGWHCIDLSIKTYTDPETGLKVRKFKPEYSEGEAQLIINQFINKRSK